MRSFDEFEKELLADPKNKKIYDELGPEFELLEKLILARNKGGVTQASLAKKMGTKQSAISRFEQGKYHPTLDFYHRLSDALGVEMKVTIR
jgi:ribosome-binding protein aMBF1 (putative translation factor)